MKYTKIVILFSYCFAIFSCTVHRKNPNDKATSRDLAIVNVDTTATSQSPKAKREEQITTNRNLPSDGLLNVRLVNGRNLFEIPDSLMDTDLLVVNRISKGSINYVEDKIGYAGDLISENVIRFTKAQGPKIYLKIISYRLRSADSTQNGMLKSLNNSTNLPIIASFDIKSGNNGPTRFVIDLTDCISGDNEMFSFNQLTKKSLNLGGFQADKSGILSVKALADNVEITTFKTYSNGFTNVTYELNSSLIRLPKDPMTPRFADQRIGYFATSFTDFDSNPQGVEQLNYIVRWRLEPKKEEEERYLRGELVEPKKPIVFYIDPTTPEKWIPFLMKGVEDWQEAFEAAGFKNAIIARRAPTKVQDSTWSIESAKQTVIVYKPSAILNAEGLRIHDPRTGEILEAHINWYHNIQKLLRNWYFIQASAIDPTARKMQFDDELMGELIRYISAHEVGHSLGLQHNFGASFSVPVEKLRDKAWLKVNGHTPSIMDYARFNYVAQPGDGITREGIFPRIGDYDKWAIEFGYRWWPKLSNEEEKTKLNHWIIERTSNNKRLWYGHQFDFIDPRSQAEDLGDNAMLAGAYGVENLKRIMPNLVSWTATKNAGYTDLKLMYENVLKQYDVYNRHVLRYIGGVLTNFKTVEQKGVIYGGVPKSTQKQAMVYLKKYAFTTPRWLLNEGILNKVELNQAFIVDKLQNEILKTLLSANLLGRLCYQSKNAEAYSAREMLADLKAHIWYDLLHSDIYRRNLQKNYINHLAKLIAFETPANGRTFSDYGPSVSDVSSLSKWQLRSLKSEITTILPKIKNLESKYHFQDCLDQINKALK